MTDKMKHLVAGLVLGFIASILFYYFTEASIFLSCIVALIVATAIAAFKEWIWDDLLGKGTFNIVDFYFTIWGGAISAFFCTPVTILVIEEILNK